MIEAPETSRDAGPEGGRAHDGRRPAGEVSVDAVVRELGCILASRLGNP